MNQSIINMQNQGSQISCKLSGPGGAPGHRGSMRLATRRGFTLVETIIAMALLGLVLAGSFALLISSYATMRRTEETLYVNRVLESAIEMTRNLSFDEMKAHAAKSPVKFSTASSLLPLYNKVNDSVDDSGYKMNLDSGSGQIVFEKLNDNLYKVTASVSWTPYRLSPTTRSVATYISSNGVNRR